MQGLKNVVCPFCGQHAPIKAIEGAVCFGIFFRCKKCRKIFEIKIK